MLLRFGVRPLKEKTRCEDEYELPAPNFFRRARVLSLGAGPFGRKCMGGFASSLIV